MHRQELIFALFALLIALILSGWDFVVDQWNLVIVGHGKAHVFYKWIVAIAVILFLSFVFLTGVVPVVWQYGNLILCN
jgi:hypothetical protein